MGSVIIDSIFDGINVKWEIFKSKFFLVIDYLFDWMIENNKI